MEEQNNRRSITALVNELADETTTLVRQEVALAKAEASEKVQQVTSGIKYLVVGGAALLVGLVYLLDALVYGIARLVPDDYRLWLGALIVGVVGGIVGLTLLKKGGNQVQASNLKPTRSTASVKRDAQTIRGQI